MGTLFSIVLYAHDPATAEKAAAAAFERVAELDAVMSDYQADSELMRLCDQPYGQPVSVSADLFDVLQYSQKVSRLSDGAFDVTVGPFVRLWRFSRKRGVLPTASELAAARAAVGYQKLRLDPANRTVTLLAPGMRLDLGGIGKGYAADQALRVLREMGLRQALVAASGDIAVGEPPPRQLGWRIGISSLGSSTNGLARTLILANAGISTSGDTEQHVDIGGIRYSHILDPTTGLGLTNRIQATIVGPDATTTDGLDTTVSVLGKERGLALVDAWPRASALVLVQEDKEIRSYVSRRFRQIPQSSAQPDF
jgi:thiamine biosynthesis lipoprotein